jgi:hypothetical protein
MKGGVAAERRRRCGNVDDAAKGRARAQASLSATPRPSRPLPGAHTGCPLGAQTPGNRSEFQGLPLAPPTAQISGVCRRFFAMHRVSAAHGHARRERRLRRPRRRSRLLRGSRPGLGGDAPLRSYDATGRRPCRSHRRVRRARDRQRSGVRRPDGLGHSRCGTERSSVIVASAPPRKPSKPSGCPRVRAPPRRGPLRPR